MAPRSRAAARAPCVYALQHPRTTVATHRGTTQGSAARPLVRVALLPCASARSIHRLTPSGRTIMRPDMLQIVPRTMKGNAYSVAHVPPCRLQFLGLERGLPATIGSATALHSRRQSDPRPPCSSVCAARARLLAMRRGNVPKKSPAAQRSDWPSRTCDAQGSMPQHPPKA
ncbi:hypothetical protein D3C71_1461790 [compost metagenome]